MATNAEGVQLSFADLQAIDEPAPETSSGEAAPARSISRSADQAASAALEAALVDARASDDDRPPLVVIASCLGQLNGSAASTPPDSCDGTALRQARDEWLRRLETSQKSQSAHVGYRVAIADDVHGPRDARYLHGSLQLGQRTREVRPSRQGRCDEGKQEDGESLERTSHRSDDIR